MQQDIEYLFGEITVQEEEPATLAELVSQYGEDAVLGEAVSNWRYRNKYPRVYRKASEEIKAAGFPREQKETRKRKDGTEAPVFELETNHLKRFYEASDENKAKLKDIITRIAVAEPLFVKGERSGAGGKISQRAQEIANAHFAKGDEHVEKVISAVEAAVPGYSVARDSEGAATPESLARGIMALQKHLAKKAEEQALAVGV